MKYRQLKQLKKMKLHNLQSQQPIPDNKKTEQSIKYIQQYQNNQKKQQSNSRSNVQSEKSEIQQQRSYLSSQKEYNSKEELLYIVHSGMSRVQIFQTVSRLIQEAENGIVPKNGRLIDPVLKAEAVGGDLQYFKLFSRLNMLININKLSKNPQKTKTPQIPNNPEQKPQPQNPNKSPPPPPPPPNPTNQISPSTFINYNINKSEEEEVKKVQKSRSKLNGECKIQNIINSMEIIFRMNSKATLESCSEHEAFWVTKCLWVRLVKNQAYEFLPRIHTQGILSIYGRVKLKFFNYLITPNCLTKTLSDQLHQFQDSFTQKMILKHIRQIYKSCSGIKGTISNSFDALTLNKIVIDYQGNALVDIAKYRPAIDNQEKKKEFYYLSPEVLLENRGSEKNDVWSLGVVVLCLLMGKRMSTSIQIHPYNNQREVIQNSKNKQQTKQKFTQLNKIKKAYEVQQKILNALQNGYISQRTYGTSRHEFRKDNYNYNYNLNQSQKMLHINEPINITHTNLPKIQQNILPTNDWKQEQRYQSSSSRNILSDLSLHVSRNLDSKLRSKIYLDVSEDFYSFLEDCLQFDEEQRPTWAQLFARHQSILNGT